MGNDKEGVLTHISIGYNINDYRIEGNRILVTSYEIYEVSLVSIPADVLAGVGRSMESSIDPEILNSTNNTINEDQSMEDDKSLADVVEEQVEAIEEVVEEIVETIESEVEEVVETIEETVEEVVETISQRELELQKEIDVLREQLEKKTLNSTEENDRVRELNALGQVLNIDVSEAIEKEFQFQISNVN